MVIGSNDKKRMEQIAVIVAGGSGKRMNSEIPKQFLLLNGEPVLSMTIRAFYQYNPEMKFIIVLPPDQIEYWKTLCKTYKLNIDHTIAEGGRTRHHSVKNAMKEIRPGCLVAVHDGVRPLLSTSLIRSCFIKAGKMGNAVPAIELSESLRQLKKDKNTSVNRSGYRLIQTPQVFNSDLLIEAFRQPYRKSFTDEASLVEAAGYMIHLVDGQRENIKLTTTLDMCIASAIITENQKR
jgi:2-C-methyl-D-erythritol 4-phosphate cytidylyltransferase